MTNFKSGLMCITQFTNALVISLLKGLAMEDKGCTRAKYNATRINTQFLTASTYVIGVLEMTLKLVVVVVVLVDQELL